MGHGPESTKGQIDYHSADLFMFMVKHIINISQGSQTESSVDRTLAEFKIAHPTRDQRIEIVHVKDIREAIKNNKKTEST